MVEPYQAKMASADRMLILQIFFWKERPQVLNLHFAPISHSPVSPSMTLYTTAKKHSPVWLSVRLSSERDNNLCAISRCRSTFKPSGGYPYDSLTGSMLRWSTWKAFTSSSPGSQTKQMLRCAPRIQVRSLLTVRPFSSLPSHQTLSVETYL